MTISDQSCLSQQCIALAYSLSSTTVILRVVLRVITLNVWSTEINVQILVGCSGSGSTDMKSLMYK